MIIRYNNNATSILWYKINLPKIYISSKKPRKRKEKRVTRTEPLDQSVAEQLVEPVQQSDNSKPTLVELWLCNKVQQMHLLPVKQQLILMYKFDNQINDVLKKLDILKINKLFISIYFFIWIYLIK